VIAEVKYYLIVDISIIKQRNTLDILHPFKNNLNYYYYNMKKYYNNNRQLVGVDMNNYSLCKYCNIYVAHRTNYKHITGIKHMKNEIKKKEYIKKSQNEDGNYVKIKIPPRIPFNNKIELDKPIFLLKSNIKK